MLPVAIFRHSPTEGPGYFAIFLERHGIPWRLVAVDQGAAIPAAAGAFSGLCFMGGPMSVNDPLPWIDQACALIRDADAASIPVIGHCLGGQLMSKALGGQVTKNPVKEIGWGEARAEDTDLARSTEESTRSILDGMAWLELQHDEEIVFQSDNADKHRATAKRLLAEGKAYRDFTPKAEPNDANVKDAIKDRARANQGEKNMRDNPYRDLSTEESDARAAAGEPFAIRLKVAETGKTSFEDAELVQNILGTLGKAVEVPERLMDAVTGLSASGPAYVAVMIEALADGGVRAGLSREVAHQLATQTVYGTAKMLLETGIPPAMLKDMVASPGGTTIAGLHAMEMGGVRCSLMDAVMAAASRAAELGKH